MGDITLILNLFYTLLCLALGGFVFFVFKVLSRVGRPRAALVLPLALYLAFWHSWIYQRFNMFPENVYESFLGTVYWYAHDAVLFTLVGVALVPLLGRSEKHPGPEENTYGHQELSQIDYHSDSGEGLPESY